MPVLLDTGEQPWHYPADCWLKPWPDMSDFSWLALTHRACSRYANENSFCASFLPREGYRRRYHNTYIARQRALHHEAVEEAKAQLQIRMQPLEAWGPMGTHDVPGTRVRVRAAAPR